jgi:hypothetical protein
LGLLALLMIPLLLIFNAPVLAAVVPGALLSVALSSIGHERPASLPPAAQVLGPEHIQDLQRMAAATTVDARSRRIG